MAERENNPRVGLFDRHFESHPVQRRRFRLATANFSPLAKRRKSLDGARETEIVGLAVFMG